MPLNPLAPVTDYQSMLNRIFWFTSAAALASVWVLRLYIPALDAALAKLDFAKVAGGDKLLPTPAGYLLPALAVGIAAHVFRLHARISDWLGIRECFDVEIIIAELADQVHFDLEPLGNDGVRQARSGLMRKAFYPYVSSSAPAIDPQLIHQALDAWSWLWVGIEASVLLTLTGFALVAASARGVGIQLLSCVLAFALVALPAMRRQCQRYAVAQVRAILASPVRAKAIRAVFEELSRETTIVRRAA